MTAANGLTLQINFTEETFGIYEKVRKDLEGNAAFQAATSVKEAYEAIKEKLPEHMTLDSFLVLYEDLKNYLKDGAKRIADSICQEKELSDEELDSVAGGWKWLDNVASWLDKNWTKVVVATASVALGAAICALTAGAGSAIVGCIAVHAFKVTAASFIWNTVAVGATVGAGVGAVMGYDHYTEHMK